MSLTSLSEHHGPAVTSADLTTILGRKVRGIPTSQIRTLRPREGERFAWPWDRDPSPASPFLSSTPALSKP